MSLRCDHCRGRLGRRAYRYWQMRFCCVACVEAYQGRLDEVTKAKIRRLDFAAFDKSRAVGARLFGSALRLLPG